MKRILALDGGGIRGVFSLEILLQMQTLLRQHYNNPKLVLADHFDLFAGTSTGAIIATCLCWGMTVEEILELYVKFGTTMFTPVPWYNPYKKYLVSRYQAQPLSEFLQRLFSEDGAGKTPALLDSAHLKQGLLVVVRNLTTGSAWPLTNNRQALYNDPTNADCNIKIPLWKVVRASTAAPTYFDPEEIRLGDRTQVFVDGSITPYNNPALIAALTAVLPCYKMEWPTGLENIRMISIGTMRFSAALPKKAEKLWLGYYAAKIPAALIQGVAWQQDYLCRCLGRCLYGEPLDSEIGELAGTCMPTEPWFGYVRYNHTYKSEELKGLLIRNPRLASLDAIQAIPLLQEVGETYASNHVKLEHLV
ncbi:MAG: patatin-like phospholipase family protein [Acidobacteriaceae bacterium]